MIYSFPFFAFILLILCLLFFPTLSLVTFCQHTVITILLTIFPTLYISYPELIYFITKHLYILISLIYFSHPLKTFPFWQRCLFSMSTILFYYVCSFGLVFRFHIEVKSYDMYLSLSDLLHII